MEQHQATANRRVLVPWAHLPSGIISLIASKYTSHAAEYAVLCTVCRHWYRSLTECSPLPSLCSPQLPFLLVPPRTICPYEAMPRLGKVFPIPFRNPFNGPQLVDDLPQLNNTESMICVGSSHGWLITLDRGSYVSLLNPVTAEVLRLNPLSTIDGKILSFDGDSPPRYHLKEKGISHTQFSLVHRAILSSDPAQDPNFTLLLFLSDLSGSCFTLRSRSGTWSHHKCPPFLIEDVVFINGVFVAINRLINLVFFDFRNKEPEPVITCYSMFVPAPFGDIFLVNSDGHLWIVFTRTMLYQNQFIIPRKYFNVFEYPLNCEAPLNREARVNAKKIKEFTDLVLFLGHGCSVSVPVRHLTCPVNTVYFVHVYSVLKGTKEEGAFRITNLYHGAVYQKNISGRTSLEPVRVFDVESSTSADLWAAPRPFWVTPNFNRIHR
jgi:Protein of unknown function (DUF295)